MPVLNTEHAPHFDPGTHYLIQVPTEDTLPSLPTANRSEDCRVLSLSILHQELHLLHVEGSCTAPDQLHFDLKCYPAIS